MVKEWINDMETKLNVVKTAITHHKEKYIIDSVNATEKPQSSKSKKDKFISNESNKGMVLDTSRSLDKPSASE